MRGTGSLRFVPRAALGGAAATSTCAQVALPYAA